MFTNLAILGASHCKSCWYPAGWFRLVYIVMEVSIVIWIPLYRWMVYFMDNPNLKWMMAGGSPMTKRKPPNVLLWIRYYIVPSGYLT